MLARRHQSWCSRERRNDMAKGQKRSNREVKKPKSAKKKPAATGRSTITTAAPKKP
jgi:hypothetical protein